MTIMGSYREKYQGLHLVKETIALSGHILSRDARQLACQLTGRLLEERLPAAQRLLSGARAKKEPWLRPLSASLETIHGVTYRTLTGHTSHINALAVLPDSQRVVSASHDGSLRVWEIEKGTIISSYQDQTLNFTTVCVAPGGRLVLAGCVDGAMCIWDWETGKWITTWSAHTGAVRGIACTPDGRLCVSASNDGSLRVWDLETQRLVHTLPGHNGPVNAVIITPDGNQAVSASSDRTLRIWRLSDGVELAKMEASWGQFAVAISPDGRSLVSGSEMVPILWDLATGQQTILTGFYGPFHQSDVTGVAFTPDGRRVISASNDETLKVWNLEEQYPLRGSSPAVWTAHRSTVTAVAVTPNGRWALSASYDQTIKVWNLVDPQNPTTQAQSTPHGNPLKWLGFGPHGEVIQLAVGYTPDDFGEDPEWLSSLEIEEKTFDWNYRTRDVVQTADRKYLFIAVGNYIEIIDIPQKTLEENKLFGVWEKLALSPDGHFALCYSWRTSRLQAWNLTTGEKTELDSRTRSVEALAITRDNRWGVVGTSDGSLKIWSLPDLAFTGEFPAHTGPVKSLVADQTGKIISCGEDSLVKVWDMTRGIALQTISLPWMKTHNLYLSGDDHRLGVVSKDGALFTLDLSAGQGLARLVKQNIKIDGIMKTELSGKPLANLALLNHHTWAATSDGVSLRLWDLTSGELLAAFSGDDEFESCAVSPDDSLLVIGTSSGRIHRLAIEMPG